MQLEVHSDDAGQRLDRFLRKLLPGATLAHIHKLLRHRRVRIDGTAAAGSARLATGQVIDLDIDNQRLQQLRGHRTTATSDSGDVDVVFRDGHLLVVDKPGGLAVHAGTGTTTNHLIARVAHLVGDSPALTFRPAPAHRIDRPTSGLVVFGLTAAGLRGMTRRFRDRAVTKTYIALVRGRPDTSHGTIALPLRRRESEDARQPKMIVDDAGTPAHTHYRVQRHAHGLTTLEIDLATGRTHQIRAHLAAIGLPIVGDRRYGDRQPTPFEQAPRIGLHAARLVFDHPVTGTPLRIDAPLPADIALQSSKLL